MRFSELVAIVGLAVAIPPADIAVAADTVASSAAPHIARVEFSGLRALDAGMLEDVLDPPFPRDSLDARLQRLGRAVYDRGFVAATFQPTLGADGTLVVRVHEGEAARLAALYLRGNQALAEIEVREILGLAPGRPFRAAEIDARLGALAAEYGARGYLDAEAVVERLEFGDAGVVLGIAISEGERAMLTEVSVEGTRATSLVARLARLATPRPADTRRIREAPLLLRRSGLYGAVGEPVLYRASDGTTSHVGVLLRVAEAQRRHTVYGGVGLARDPRRDRAVLTGAVDLALRNLDGSGRDVAAAWSRDALSGSRLALGYRARFVLGSPLDLAIDLGTQVRDSTFTAQSAGTSLALPVNRTTALEAGLGVDRSVYHIGTTGNTLRGRAHVGLAYTSLGREVDRRRWGDLETRVERAWRRNDLVRGGVEDRERVEQTLWSGRFEAGVPLGARWGAAARGAWSVLSSDEAEVEPSELSHFGGARTLRGYREEQFRGDQVAYGGIELRYGPSRAAQLYAFLDAGTLRRKRRDAAPDTGSHAGAGVGLRAEVATGALDVSFALGEERSFADTKLHVALRQRF